MKILYAVQATGNGHISRAIELLPHIEQLGDTHIFLSGSNAHLPFPYPVKYRSKGISLFYKSGGLDYLRMATANNLPQAIKEAKHLPVDKYDLVLNDFEPITTLACKWKQKKSVHFGHQASFSSKAAPRPRQRSLVGEKVLKHYAGGTQQVGLHFKRYDNFIFPPVIRKSILEAEPLDKGHITLYLPAVQEKDLKAMLHRLPEFAFECFIPGRKTCERYNNIWLKPIEQNYFTESLANCYGLITGAGFETPAEALYLQKKLMCIPIKGQYEQYCNATALEEFGVPVLNSLNPKNFPQQIVDWLSAPALSYRQEVNNIPEMLQYVQRDVQ